MAGKHGGTTDHRPVPSRPGLGREWIAILFGIACVGFGMYVLWAQHTGITADVKVLECHDAGRHAVCSGQWQDGTVMSPVRIVAMSSPAPRRHRCDAHSRQQRVHAVRGTSLDVLRIRRCDAVHWEVRVAPSPAWRLRPVAAQCLQPCSSTPKWPSRRHPVSPRRVRVQPSGQGTPVPSVPMLIVRGSIINSPKVITRRRPVLQRRTPRHREWMSAGAAISRR